MNINGLPQKMCNLGRIAVIETAKITVGASSRPDSPILGGISSKVVADLFEATRSAGKTHLERMESNPLNIFHILSSLINKIK